MYFFLCMSFLLGGNGLVVFKCETLITSLSLHSPQYSFVLPFSLLNAMFRPISESKKATLVHNKRCSRKTPAPGHFPFTPTSLALHSYHSELVGGSTVLKEDVYYVCVSLLGCLMQRCIPILSKEDGKNALTSLGTKSMILMDAKEKGVYLCFGINFC